MKPDTKCLLPPDLKSELMHLVMQRHAQALIEEQEEANAQIAKQDAFKPIVKAAPLTKGPLSEHRKAIRDLFRNL
ncbi:hypothetical protein JLK41_16600 [Ectopseudomonas khazarica]|uniref:hypothetical protein n=1 Tax=Ectopseudomonas khazarica TaxID=2502979 RepID=UPI001AF0005E|nr:hypothetical protein [Pseudomonas khazarica]QTS84935.1 hypothetical protein JLK41_16600 [Pseudomonas khazarica]